MSLLDSLEHLSDEQLMSDYQSGNIEALGFLLNRLRPKMDQVARSQILDRELANDAIQEACITVFKTATSFRGDSKVFTWVYRILVNACIDLLRKERTRTSLNTDDEQLVTKPDLAPDFVEQKNAYLVVHESLKALPKDQREAVFHVYIEGFTVEEASELLRVPIGTVKSRCDRGKKALAEILRENPIIPEPNKVKKRLKSGGGK